MDNEFNPKEMQEIKRILDKIAQNKNPFETPYYKDYINSLYKSKNKEIPFKTKGYLGAALALPTFYSILNNPAYSMQQKAENIIGEGMNYIPILGDLTSPTATDEEMQAHYEEWVKQGKPNYQKGN